MSGALHVVRTVEEEEAAVANVMRLFQGMRNTSSSQPSQAMERARAGTDAQQALIPYAKHALEAAFGVEVSDISFMGFVLIRFKTAQILDVTAAKIPCTTFGRDAKSTTREYAVELKDLFPFLFQNPGRATSVEEGVSGVRTKTTEALLA